MSKNTSIALGDHFETFIRKQLKTGRFATASEVVRAGLRLLEQEEQHLKILREALIAGEESGKAKLFDNEALKKRMRKKYLKPNV